MERHQEESKHFHRGFEHTEVSVVLAAASVVVGIESGDGWEEDRMDQVEAWRDCNQAHQGVDTAVVVAKLQEFHGRMV